MCFAKRAVLSLRVPLSLYRVGLSLSIVAVGLTVLGLYVLTCITLHYLIGLKPVLISSFCVCLGEVVVYAIRKIILWEMSFYPLKVILNI